MNVVNTPPELAYHGAIHHTRTIRREFWNTVAFLATAGIALVTVICLAIIIVNIAGSVRCLRKSMDLEGDRVAQSLQRFFRFSARVAAGFISGCLNCAGATLDCDEWNTQVTSRGSNVATREHARVDQGDDALDDAGRRLLGGPRYVVWCWVSDRRVAISSYDRAIFSFHLTRSSSWGRASVHLTRVRGVRSFAAMAPSHGGPRKEDAPQLECQVCHHLARHLYATHTGGPKAGTEDAVIDFVEKSTTAWRPEGAWMTHLHVMEARGARDGGGFAWVEGVVGRVGRWMSRLRSGSVTVEDIKTEEEGKKSHKDTSLPPASPPSLVLVHNKVPGQCNLACRTIEYTAQRVMGENDADVGEALYVGRYPSLEAFQRWFCDELTGACARRANEKNTGEDTRPAPEEKIEMKEGGTVDGTAGSHHRNRRTAVVQSDVYGAFLPRKEGEQDVERILGEMADQGLRGKMYTREEAMEKYMLEMGDGFAGLDEREL